VRVAGYNNCVWIEVSSHHNWRNAQLTRLRDTDFSETMKKGFGCLNMGFKRLRSGAGMVVGGGVRGSKG
jgi:hypothetical protein